MTPDGDGGDPHERASMRPPVDSPAASVGEDGSRGGLLPDGVPAVLSLTHVWRWPRRAAGYPAPKGGHWPPALTQTQEVLLETSKTRLALLLSTAAKPQGYLPCNADLEAPGLDHRV